MKGFIPLALCGLLLPTVLHAGKPTIEDVRVNQLGEGRFRFDVTLRHADSGWEHYANRWEIRSTEGELLGVRELAHPHVNEQPFTRSLTVTLTDGITEVHIRAFDSVHGESTEDYPVTLP